MSQSQGHREKGWEPVFWEEWMLEGFLEEVALSSDSQVSELDLKRETVSMRAQKAQKTF